MCNRQYTKTSNRQKYCSKTCVYRSRKSYVLNWNFNNPECMIYKGAKWRAKKKNLEFDLLLEDIEIPETCPVLGIKLKQNQTGRSGYYNDSYSLDRINPNKGYTKDNIRVISNRANLLKSNATVQELEKVLQDLKLHSCR